MQPIPYIFFQGTCGEAMRTYGRIFGSEPEVMTFGDLPPGESMDTPPPPDAVMHAAIRIGDGWLYGSDDPSGETPAMAGTNVHLSFPDATETRRVFDALAEGDAEVRMPLEPAFWTPLFGALTDRFGTRWMISQDGEAD